VEYSTSRPSSSYGHYLHHCGALYEQTELYHTVITISAHGVEHYEQAELIFTVIIIFDTMKTRLSPLNNTLMERAPWALPPPSLPKPRLRLWFSMSSSRWSRLPWTAVTRPRELS
jgi:hypothetical protein